MMYDLWQVSGRGKVQSVAKIGDYPSVPAAKKAALKHGPGRYHICDPVGNAVKVRVGTRRRAG